MYVVNNPTQCGSVFNEQGLVTSLKQVAIFSAESIKPRRQGAMEPMHTLYKRRIRRFHSEMEMIGHQHISMDLPAKLSASLKEGSKKDLCRPNALEQVMPVVSSIEDMVDRSGKFDPQPPGHVYTTPPFHADLNANRI